jgi:hypothetical protein
MSQFRALEGQWKKVKMVPDEEAHTSSSVPRGGGGGGGGGGEVPAPPRRAESMLLTNKEDVISSSPMSAPPNLFRANTAPPSVAFPIVAPKAAAAPGVSAEPTPEPSPRPYSAVIAPMSPTPLRTGERLSPIVVEEVSPLVCPVGKKTRITISGTHFDENVGVRIGGLDCVCRVLNAVLIIVESPPSQEEGQRDVEVYDKLGDREPVLLPSMITYMEQAWKTEAEMIDSILDEDSDDEFDERTLLYDIPRREVVITSLDPVISPLQGTTIALTGTGFDSNCAVLVDGVDCDQVVVSPPTTQGGPVRLTFRSPRLWDGGHKRVEVVNPLDGSRGHLDDVLVYVHNL